MRFFTVIGDLPHEREHPQPLEVDVEVRADLERAGVTDRLEDGVDYRRLYEAVAQAVDSTPDSPPPRLLEAVGEQIARRLLAVDRVEAVRVRCRKPWAALRGPVDRVEIEIDRQ